MKDTFDALVNHLLSGNILLGEGIQLLERRMIEGALERSGGRQPAASKMLGIHRNTLQRKMADYQLLGRRASTRRKPAASAGRPKRKSGVA